VTSPIAAAVAHHYDELDSIYRSLWGEHVHHGLWRHEHDTAEQAVVQLVDHAAAALGLSAGDEVIDVGAGYGATARHLAAHYGTRVTGYTVSPVQHAFALRHDAPGVGLLLRDWHTNEQPDQSADAVLAIESTEHMADLPFALAEMRRVLRPGGKVAIYAWLAGESPSRWQQRWLLEPIARTGRLVTLAPASELARLLEAAGFVGVAFEDLTAAVAPTWKVGLRRLAWKILSDRRYLRYLIRSTNDERGFLSTIPRIRAAYGCGAMRYGLFVGTA
jgi:tocopherol O-methyltransferase